MAVPTRYCGALIENCGASKGSDYQKENEGPNTALRPGQPLLLHFLLYGSQ